MAEENDEPANAERSAAFLFIPVTKIGGTCTGRGEQETKQCLYILQHFSVCTPASLRQLTYDPQLHSPRQFRDPAPSPVLRLRRGHRHDEGNRATNGAVWLTSLSISMTASPPATPLLLLPRVPWQQP